MSILFKPINIGRLKLPNRVLMAPMGTLYANECGAVTKRLINYYTERSRGGIGLVIVENALVTADRKPCRLNISGDQFLPGLNELAEAIEENGGIPSIQLNQYLKKGQTVMDLSEEEIRFRVDAFVQAAMRAMTAGFKAVEIHCAHYYLINQFISRYYNKRNDAYGGSIERNIKFAIDVISGIRKKLGPGYPIISRINGSDFVPDGNTVHDAIKVAQSLVEAGVDAVHVSAGVSESKEWMIQPACMPHGCLIHLAEKVKEAVKVPVIGVGRINSPQLAERYIREGKVDLIALGRAVIADPYFLYKVRSGREDEIRKCIGCNMCTGRTASGLRLKCSINMFTGREGEIPCTPAGSKKSVLVVGGGPAGLEAARVLAIRGHRVILCEKEKELGGQLIPAAIPPHKESIATFLKYLTGEIGRLGVDVRMETEVTDTLLDEINPDHVFIATGAEIITPDIPGIDGKNVFTYEKVLLGRINQIGERAVVAGGGSVGCEVAEFLAAKQKKVTIVEMSDDIALDVEAATRKLLLKRLCGLAVAVQKNKELVRVEADGVIVKSCAGYEKILCDSVVMALGLRINSEITGKIENRGLQVTEIGNCKRPGKIIDAIHQGAKAACFI